MLAVLDPYTLAPLVIVTAVDVARSCPHRFRSIVTLFLAGSPVD